MSNQANQDVVRPAIRVHWGGLAGYLIFLVAGIGLFLLIRDYGAGLTAPPTPADSQPVGGQVSGHVDVVFHVVATLSAVVFLGIVLAKVCRYLGQPPVIGEVVAGILLGPSVLGAISPEAMHVLIPSSAQDPSGQVPAAIRAVSQLGVILYMFLVGLHLNGARLAKRIHAAVAVSHASILAPFVLGTALAIWLYPIFSHQGVPFTSFAMFMGVAMSITAFPVLARILTDRNLDKTEIGGVALSCAAADDVTAWCLLAFVVGIARANLEGAVWVIGGAIVFVVFVFVILRPILKRLLHKHEQQAETPSSSVLPAILLVVLLAALATEGIGIHALFGAFLLGAVLPHDSRVAQEVTAKSKDLVTVLLLPAFFAFSGMRTQIQLMSGWESWFWCGVIIVVATVGKFGGTFVAARLTGLNWRESTILGTLMNTRGLMELIVLNIGLDLGMISPTLFAMMVVMALVTTAATGPIVDRLGLGKQCDSKCAEG